MYEMAPVFIPILGESIFVLRNEHFDLYQEISNTGFGDMLHDQERNSKYYAAIRKVIADMHRDGRQVHVLDIGTGTGLLSMMAVKAGADTVTACESFLPMANCAARILKLNGMADKVVLIRKRSTDLTVGEDGDMKQKANLLVAELLDTELIGEGALGIYEHAHAELLTDDVICIPSHATCYAQVVDSTLATQWNTLKVLPNLDGDILIRTPSTILNCKGTAALHDVQLSQMQRNTFNVLTAPIPIFDFDFMSKIPIQKTRSAKKVVKTVAGGFANLVFFWWNIKLDVEGDVKLSCAPYWAHPDFKQLTAATTASKKPLQNHIPWRDHWMQAVYYIPKPLKLTNSNCEFTLSCHHDEFSFWFDAFENSTPTQSVERHFCTCLLHQTYSRTRIGQINYALRNKFYMQFLENTVNENAHVLVLGDGSVLGLATSKLGAASVICLEPEQLSRQFMESLAYANDMNNVRFVDDLKAIDDATLAKITHVFAEPYFIQSIFPWDNFYFGTLINQLKPQLMPNVTITPHSARIYCLPVEFVDLQKFNQPIGTCEGFDMSLFDNMVQESKQICNPNAHIEVFSLWEYPCRALANPITALCLTFDDFSLQCSRSGQAVFESEGTCNGVAIWITWHLDEYNLNKTKVCGGPSLPVEPGEYVTWNMFQQQGAYLMGAGTPILDFNKQFLKWNVAFSPTNGSMEFNFEIISEP